MYEQEFLARSRGMLFEFDAVQADAHHAIDHYDTRAAAVGAYTGDAKPPRISKQSITIVQTAIMLESLDLLAFLNIDPKIDYLKYD